MVGPRLEEGTETPGLTAEGLFIDPPWGLILAAIFIGTSCTEAEAAGVAVVSRMEVFPLPGTILGPTELGVFIVNGNEVGGRMIVVAVARGTVPAVRGVPLAGGVLVNTVTLLFMTAKFTCCCCVVALGTANNGGRETGPLCRPPPLPPPPGG